MARPLRIEFPGALYHVMSRGDGSFATAPTGRSGSSGSGGPSRPAAGGNAVSREVRRIDNGPAELRRTVDHISEALQ